MLRGSNGNESATIWPSSSPITFAPTLSLFTSAPSFSPTSSLLTSTTSKNNSSPSLFNETTSDVIDKALDLVLLTLPPTLNSSSSSTLYPTTTTTTASPYSSSSAPTTTTNYSVPPSSTLSPSPLAYITLVPSSPSSPLPTAISNHTSAQQQSAVDTLLDQGYVFSASPYEPSGWDQIFAAVLLSVSIFLLPSFIAFVSLMCKQQPAPSPAVDDGAPASPQSPARTPSSSSALRSALSRRWRALGRYAKVFHRFAAPHAWTAADCDGLGCEAASLLLLERELGRFLCFLAVLVNLVLLPVYLSFPAQPQGSDFTPYTFQNVPVTALRNLVWIQVGMVYLISLLTWRFSSYLAVQLGQIESRFSATNALSAQLRYLFVSGKHHELMTERALVDKCKQERWFHISNVQSVKLFHQAQLQPDVFAYRCLVTVEADADEGSGVPPPPPPAVGIEVEPAPNPKDILWDSFSHSRWVVYARSLVVNVVLMCTLFLFTTPVTFISFWSTVSTPAGDVGYTYIHLVAYVRQFNPWFGDFIFGFLPQLFLVVCDAYLLMFLSLSAKQFELFRTSSEREVSLLKKDYWFLLFNTLILPSLALSSVGGFVGRLFDNETSAFALLGKAFVTTSGGFTLTFVASQTWVGASLDIARLSERAYVGIMTKCVRPCKRLQQSRSTTPAAAAAGGERIGLELDSAGEYAISLVMFALCIMFSTVVPPILLFGVVYFFVKQGTDDYLLRYVYLEAEKLPKAYVGRSALRYLPIAPILLQSSLFGFFSSEACMPKLTDMVGVNNVPCVHKDYSGVLVVRADFAQLFAMLLCLVATCVVAVREWVVALRTDGRSWGGRYSDQPPPQRSAAVNGNEDDGDDEGARMLAVESRNSV